MKLYALAAIAALGLAGCSDKAQNEVGEAANVVGQDVANTTEAGVNAVDGALDSAGASMDNAIDATGNAAANGAAATERAAERTGQAAENAAEEVEAEAEGRK